MCVCVSACTRVWACVCVSQIRRKRKVIRLRRCARAERARPSTRNGKRGLRNLSRQLQGRRKIQSGRGCLYNFRVLLDQYMIYVKNTRKLSETIDFDACGRAKLRDKTRKIPVRGYANQVPQRPALEAIVKCTVRFICTSENALQPSLPVEASGSNPRVKESLDRTCGDYPLFGQKVADSSVPKLAAVKVLRQPFGTTAPQEVDPKTAVYRPQRAVNGLLKPDPVQLPSKHPQ